jgi:cold shock CspA family protein
MKGRVLFWKDHTDKPGGFGFIAQEGCSRRELNFWFGPKAIIPLKGRVPRSGEIVEFEPGEFKKDKGPQAARVLAILDDDAQEITTLEGIDDVA